ncbi:MAG TPA: hypothetical protein VJQ44_18740 [Gemmatimonadales bacterium]|nr:hypothetical protein [Gemmatimonadales bacterium]
MSWRATGGRIDASGLYRAGAESGSYRVIAVLTSALADTAEIAITKGPAPTTLVSPPRPLAKVEKGTRSIPFGASQMWNAVGRTGTESFDLVHEGVRAGNIVQRIEEARRKHLRLLLNMTGGHDPYMSSIGGIHQFDMQRWRDSMATYDTERIKAAVAAAVADGVIIGNSVMDEPHVIGQGDGNTWGPKGTMTKARVDSMCGYVKSIFPTMPVGVVHQHQLFEPGKSYRVCDFLVDQYQQSYGDVTAWRDAALAMAHRDGIQILFGANELNGGPKDRDGEWDCKDEGGYKGQSRPNCQISPDSLERWYPLLARAGCGFRVWRWDGTRTNDPAYRAARRAVRDSLAAWSAPTCARP